MKTDVDLSVVVPVWNAARHLPSLAERMQQLDVMGVSWQLIFVDDGSTDESAAVAAQLSSETPRILAIANPRNLGAGEARNLGWKHTIGRYTIFFDADDDLRAEVIAPAIARMDANPEVDTAIFAYRYEREETASFTAMTRNDEEIFRQVLKGQAETIGSLEQMARVLRLTNYPWNKIIRTDRFREVGIKFGTTKVHNDILGHWYSLLFARQIMVRNDIICTHVVHPKGNNLTNRAGSDRLQVFDALTELYDMLETHEHLRRRYSHYFWDLADGLARWARPRIGDDYRQQLDARYADLIGRIALEDLARIRIKRTPKLATAIVNHLLF